ncbi:MAG: NAD(P)-binding domain-containing protein [Anaerolineales bacterium]|nr:NAD(P)-binding domain-containing protein [Anaerolineales bacterium]
MKKEKIGFIGYGHMGGALLRSLLAAGAFPASRVVVSTRTAEKLKDLKRSYPGIEVAENNRAAAEKSALLFLCVGTSQVQPALAEIRDVLDEWTHLVSISGGVEMACVERLAGGPFTKIMPTLIAEAGEGVALVCHNAKVPPAQKTELERMLKSVGEVRVIAESQFEAGAELTSCFPGLLASICDQFARVGANRGGFTRAEAADLVLHTMRGTAELLKRNREDFQSLMRRVATPGGSTEAGINVLERDLPEVFDRVFAASLERHEARKQSTRKQFLAD